MSFWDKITGDDMNKEFEAFEARVKKLPADYQNAWENIKENLWGYSDFTGRNLIPVLDSALDMLEETAADGQSVQQVLGDDIKGFCLALVGDEGAKMYRDKLREKLNNNIAKRLEK